MSPSSGRDRDTCVLLLFWWLIISSSSQVVVYGALVVGPNCDELELEGDVAVYYCPEVLQQINLIIPNSRYISFNGWQELSRN